MAQNEPGMFNTFYFQTIRFPQRSSDVNPEATKHQFCFEAKVTDSVSFEAHLFCVLTTYGIAKIQH
jgi:hypothetical protein